MKNKATFNPKVAAILDKYFAKFRDKAGDKPVPATPAPAAAPVPTARGGARGPFEFLIVLCASRTSSISSFPSRCAPRPFSPAVASGCELRVRAAL
eukprot:4266456-Prymnesium_polylepis.1